MLKKIYLLSVIPILLGLFPACSNDLPNFSAPDPVEQAAISAERDFSKEQCPISDKKPEKVLLDVNTAADTPFVDLDRDVKDVGNSVVVKEFFKTKDTLYNFMKLGYGSIDSALDAYRKQHGLDERAVSIIFKGGNVLRIIANQTLLSVPPRARNLLKESYNDIFKRSDIDFSVIVDEARLTGLDYEKTMKEITELIYETLNEVRKEIMASPENYFNFFQLRSKFAQRGLKEYLSKLQDLEALKDPENDNWYKAEFAQLQILDKMATADLVCDYEGQFDYRFDFNPAKDSIVGTPLTEDGRWIMNSINTTLGWPFASDPKKAVRFYLVRSKAQFELTYLKDGKLKRKPIGGELIDVSLPLREDSNLKELIEHYDSWLTDYNLNLDDTDETIKIKSESLKGLAADINGIVLVQYDRPWDAPKYQKRFDRLFLLSIVETLSTLGFGSAQVGAYLNTVQKEIIEPIKSIFPINPDQSPLVAERLLQSAEKLAAEYPDLSIANGIWQGVSGLINKVVANNDEDDETKFKELTEVIQKNVAIMMQLSQMSLEKIDINDIYNAKMSSFF